MKYRDQEGREVSLSELCRQDPEWAANRIRVLSEAPAEMGADPDEPRTMDSGSRVRAWLKSDDTDDDATVCPEEAERWRAEGWNVTPLVPAARALDSRSVPSTTVGGPHRYADIAESATDYGARINPEPDGGLGVTEQESAPRLNGHAPDLFVVMLEHPEVPEKPQFWVPARWSRAAYLDPATADDARESADLKCEGNGIHRVVEYVPKNLGQESVGQGALPGTGTTDASISVEDSKDLAKMLAAVTDGYEKATFHGDIQVAFELHAVREIQLMYEMLVRILNRSREDEAARDGKSLIPEDARVLRLAARYLDDIDYVKTDAVAEKLRRMAERLETTDSEPVSESEGSESSSESEASDD